MTHPRIRMPELRVDCSASERDLGRVGGPPVGRQLQHEGRPLLRGGPDPWISPPWPTATWRTMYNPSPMLPSSAPGRRPRWNGSNSPGSSSVGIGAPWLCTESSALPSRMATRTVTGRSGSPCWSALPTRFPRAWAMRSGSHIAGRVVVGSALHAPDLILRHPLEHAGHHRIQRHRLGGEGQALPLPDAGHVEQPGDDGLHPLRGSLHPLERAQVLLADASPLHRLQAEAHRGERIPQVVADDPEQPLLELGGRLELPALLLDGRAAERGLLLHPPAPGHVPADAGDALGWPVWRGDG